jgi:hypothetical protein
MAIKEDVSMGRPNSFAFQFPVAAPMNGQSNTTGPFKSSTLQEMNFDPPVGRQKKKRLDVTPASHQWDLQVTDQVTKWKHARRRAPPRVQLSQLHIHWRPQKQFLFFLKRKICERSRIGTASNGASCVFSQIFIL